MGSRLAAWVRRAPLGRGRWMTTLGGFLAVQTVSLLLVSQLQGRASRPDSVLVAAGLAFALAGLLLCGVGLPLMAHGRRVRKWRQRYLLRLQDARGWFVAGRIAQADLDGARDALEEAAAGRFAGEAQRTAGDILRRAGGLAAAWGIAAAWTGWRIGLPGLGLVLLAAGAGALLAGAAMALRGWRQWRSGRALTAAYLERLEQEERRLLDKARKGASRRPSLAP